MDKGVISFRFFDSYDEGLSKCKNDRQKLLFIETMLDFMFRDIEPEFNEDDADEFIVSILMTGMWPSLKKSKGTSNGGKKTKGQDKPWLKGNDHSKKGRKQHSNNTQTTLKQQDIDIDIDIDKEGEGEREGAPPLPLKDFKEDMRSLLKESGVDVTNIKTKLK